MLHSTGPPTAATSRRRFIRRLSNSTAAAHRKPSSTIERDSEQTLGKLTYTHPSADSLVHHPLRRLPGRRRRKGPAESRRKRKSPPKCMGGFFFQLLFIPHSFSKPRNSHVNRRKQDKFKLPITAIIIKLVKNIPYLISHELKGPIVSSQSPNEGRA